MQVVERPYTHRIESPQQGDAAAPAADTAGGSAAADGEGADGAAAPAAESLVRCRFVLERLPGQALIPRAKDGRCPKVGACGVGWDFGCTGRRLQPTFPHCVSTNGPSHAGGDEEGRWQAEAGGKRPHRSSYRCPRLPSTTLPSAHSSLLATCKFLNFAVATQHLCTCPRCPLCRRLSGFGAQRRAARVSGTRRWAPTSACEPFQWLLSRLIWSSGTAVHSRHWCPSTCCSCLLDWMQLQW